MTLPEGGEAEVMSYTAGGQPVTVEVRGQGQTQTIGYAYDPLTKQLTNTYYSQSSELNSTLSYDLEGRLISVADGAQSSNVVTRDIMGNPLTLAQAYTDGPTALPYAFEFNDDGSLESQETPVGEFIYDADGLGRTVSVAGPQGTTTYEYDEDSGLLIKQTLPNGIFTLYQYNNRGQMSGMAHYQPGDPDVLLAEYSDITYDAAGRRIGYSAQIAALPDYSGSYSFTYNAKGELTGEEFTPDDQLLPPVEKDYSYSAAGNITNFNGTERRYNGANQLTQEWINGQWVTVASYDERGNPIEYRGHALEFNQGNNLTVFDETLTAGYSSDGRRIWKEVNNQRTFFIYDGDTLIGEMDEYGNPSAVNTIGATGLISRQPGGSLGDAVYYLFDPLGNVLHRLDDDGVIVSSDVYDAWGNREYSNDLTGDPYGYKGQYGYYTDHETGLILCTYRYYDPETGRWLTKDPIGHEGGVNLYGYCANDAVNMIDPSGLTKYYLYG